MGFVVTSYYSLKIRQRKILDGLLLSPTIPLAKSLEKSLERKRPWQRRAFVYLRVT